MTEHEFDIIEHYFKPVAGSSNNVVLGPGDDAAILTVPAGMELCVSTDSLIEDVHFPAGVPPWIAASRTFAANLSDMAAMGAEPHSFVLAVSMPEANEQWLHDFSESLRDLSMHYGIPLVGGNLARGKLSLTITVMGMTPAGRAVRRSGARLGDDIYVTGMLGDAAGGLPLVRKGDYESYLAKRYCSPEARVDAGMRLREVVNAMIDVSDGLFADLGHITEASGLGAIVDTSVVPLSMELVENVGEESAVRLGLFSGDDYELCFTAGSDKAEAIHRISEEMNLPITRIGTMVEGEGVIALDESHKPLDVGGPGYQHF